MERIIGVIIVACIVWYFLPNNDEPEVPEAPSTPDEEELEFPDFLKDDEDDWEDDTPFY